VSEANVVPLHPFDDAEALAFLSRNGRIETSVSDLACQFRWPPIKLRRRLAAWVKAGQITRLASGRGRVIIAPVAGHADPLPTVRPSIGAPPIERGRGADAPGIRSTGRSVVAFGAAAVLFATALGLAAIGLTMNARFAASFGQTTEAAVILAAIGLAIDVLAVVLPTAAVLLWCHRARATTVLAWTIWLVALAMTLLAAIGFASTNIGDSVAGRARIAGEDRALAERVERLRAERAGIVDTRAEGAIEAALQAAQPGAQSVWKATSGCHDVTLPASARACATVLQLREDLATVKRRDAIDAELHAAEARLASLPAINAADPQATAAAEIVGWLSAGRISPAAHDIDRLRTIGLTITPALAGLVAMLALSLVRAARRQF
jgi:hypothetical protein